MKGIRVRYHSDGRVALWSPIAEEWSTSQVPEWLVTKYPSVGWYIDEHVHSLGWSELLVTELPKPDGHLDIEVGPDLPYWRITGGSIIASDDEVYINDRLGDLDAIRSDALKMLAAVTTVERYRAEQGEDEE